MTGTSLLSGSRAAGGRRVLEKRLAPLALAGAAVALVAVLTVRSPQLGCAAALVGTVTALYVAHPAAGGVALWSVWLVTPGVRRVLGLETGFQAADPLSVAPLAATAIVAALAARGAHLPRRPKVVLGLAAAGLALGLPAGLGNPAAAAYGLVSYGAALGGLVIGWTEATGRTRRWTLAQTLVVGAPALAAYGLYQHVLGLPEWDRYWLASADVTSIGSPELGSFRIFSTVNAPGTLALVLLVALLLALVRRRLGPWTLAALAVIVVALGLTLVRSAWLGLAVAVLAMAVASRGRALGRVLLLLAVLAGGYVLLSASGAASSSFLERIESLSDLGGDASLQARRTAPLELLPEAVRLPFGHGLGTAGEATRLGGSGGLRASDNGYLAMTYQLGLTGGLLIVGALLWATVLACRACARARTDRALVGIVAVLAAYLAMLATGDQFYGLPGLILWYVAGLALARAHLDEPPTPTVR